MEDFLKEIWPVAIFLAISVISGIRNASKTSERKQDAQQPRPHTLDENFPEVEILEPPFMHSTETVKPRKPSGNVRADKGNVSAANVAKPAEAPATPAAERGAKVAFKGKSDAKKAFIYSEIFNRKYT